MNRCSLVVLYYFISLGNQLKCPKAYRLIDYARNVLSELWRAQEFQKLRVLKSQGTFCSSISCTIRWNKYDVKNSCLTFMPNGMVLPEPVPATTMQSNPKKRFRYICLPSIRGLSIKNHSKFVLNRASSVNTVWLGQDNTGQSRE